MAERAAALGGTLQAGPEPGGGFVVCARLPRRGGGR
jgi:signal transduction histidine kinase